MNKDIMLKFIEEDDELEKFQKMFLLDMWKMTYNWKEVSSDLLLMNKNAS